MLPLLTVLFLISYGLMTMLIVEQGRTIDSQRALIRDLFRDSTELTALKIQISQGVFSGKPHGPAAKNPAAKSPTNTPSTQEQQNPRTPSSQAAQEMQKQLQKQPIQPPSRPASDLQDAQRALVTI